MEDDTLADAIPYILLLRVESFPKMYVTLCPPKWYPFTPSGSCTISAHLVNFDKKRLNYCSYRHFINLLLVI